MLLPDKYLLRFYNLSVTVLGTQRLKKSPALMELEFNQEEWDNKILKNKIHVVCQIRATEKIKQETGIGNAREGRKCKVPF